MAKKIQNKNDKNLVLYICGAVIATIIILIIIILATTQTKVDDSYFTSDSSKYVISLDVSNDKTEYPPVKAHMVYHYSGDKITDVKIYYEFKDETEAKKAFEAGKESDDVWSDYEKLDLGGKYVVLTAKASEYENLKASDIKSQVEFIELVQELNAEN